MSPARLTITGRKEFVARLVSGRSIPGPCHEPLRRITFDTQATRDWGADIIEDKPGPEVVFCRDTGNNRSHGQDTPPEQFCPGCVLYRCLDEKSGKKVADLQG